MIRAIFWDIGGVLCRLKDETFHRKWENRLGLLESQLTQIVFGSDIADQATIGEAAPAQVWERVGQTLKLSTEALNSLKVEIWHGGAWVRDLLKLIASLKPTYKTGIISDGWLDSREAVGEWINEELFDVIMYSAEEGVKKPNPIIYERMLQRLGVKADEAIFIDDWQESVEGAQEVGLKSIQYTNEVDVIEEVETIMKQMGVTEKPD